MKVFLAGSEQIEALSVLFDEYRVFYKQPSDHVAAKKFLQERFQNHDSVIIAASLNDEIVGFVQLYPSFSSVSMKRVWILNDLFVKEDHRRKGVATLLMSAAEEYAHSTQAVRIVLATQILNKSAQVLYEAREYIRDEEFYHYTFRL